MGLGPAGEDHVIRTYIDVEGAACDAFQLEGPTILNTTDGERCGESGQWAIYVPANQGRPVILGDADFRAAFTLAE